MKKYIIIIAIIIASMASVFGQNYAYGENNYSEDSTIMVFDMMGQLVCKAKSNRPMTDQEKIDWFEAKHANDIESGVYFLKSGNRFFHLKHTECANEASIRETKPAPTIKTVEYADTWFMLGDYEFIEMEGLVGSDSDCLVGYVESDYKKVYACSCDYNESVRVMNALNSKKGSNSNITYTVNRKYWGNGDYDVRVIVTFKDAKAEYMAERNNRLNSID